MNKIYKIGLDVGSTTVKLVVINENNEIKFSIYERHFSDVRQSVAKLLISASLEFKKAKGTLAITGSGGIAVANYLDSFFVQEVIAGAQAIKYFIPKTDVAIELGGEDAKITFFDAGIDQRMNESCAGGTGAFIDQMASFLQTDPQGLNELAKEHKTIYPIAARCGVFAKSDILPLLNEGASQADIAVSIFQAVVDQTIGGLACGRSIKGQVAFLGGPLFFLSELQKRFRETLGFDEKQAYCPPQAQYFVALGAALSSVKAELITFNALGKLADFLTKGDLPPEIEPLPALFQSEKEVIDFQNRHKKATLNKAPWPSEGKVFLGLDAGSTTTKLVVINNDGHLLFSAYGPNQGSPLPSVIEILTSLYKEKPKDVEIAYSAVTGYGEALLMAALGLDIGEVETVAHFQGASFFAPNVSFIVDIGGQDIKCLSIKKGIIDGLMLNEACSSGCGSFLENFAQTLKMDALEFSKVALESRKPVDLGSRCTVFMNSKVKQAQKEGVEISDISAGLSYSVVRNALYKVIKINKAEDFGKQVVVQGGTFLNDSVLRAFEKLTEREVIRPNISGLMGAFGAALLAKDNYYKNDKTISPQSTLIRAENLSSFEVKINSLRCAKCSNRCLLTINRFSAGHRFISGNRCQKGSVLEGEALKSKSLQLPNLYEWKENRLFNYYQPLSHKNIKGTVGIPRVLNFYDNYPFWFTFFTNLGFRVELSPPSSKELYNLGLETIPSQTVCYPAKLVHGHMVALAKKDLDFIFYPALPFAEKLSHKTDNHYNCPVVGAYPELIRLNMDIFKEKNLALLAPFLDLNSASRLKKRLESELSFLNLKNREIKKALRAAYREQKKYKRDLKKAGEQALDYLEKNKCLGLVLAGHPYHVDSEINHGIPELIIANGLAVLSEDAISHLGGEGNFNLRVCNQWAYHSHSYQAANYITKRADLEMVQLVSFGCGIDAIVSDQLTEILEGAGKIYTMLKIDEGANLGAARIRVRSLVAAIRARGEIKPQEIDSYIYQPVNFTSEMAKNYTLLCPQMSPSHWQFLDAAMAPLGYNLEVLPSVSRQAVEEGLRYVNNDACYPALMVIGQLIEALKSGQYDLDKTAVIMSQTGGGCRATNYVALLRKALTDSGFDKVPVAPFGVVQENSPLKISPKLWARLFNAILYGDMLSRLLLATRPYEKKEGRAQDLYNHWSKKVHQSLGTVNQGLFSEHMVKMVKDFSQLDLIDDPKAKVGLVGEILLRFHPDANNQAIEIIEAEGGEAVAPDMANFYLYCMYDDVARSNLLSGSRWKKFIANQMIKRAEKVRQNMRNALAPYPQFGQIETIHHLSKQVEGLVSLANQTGEGWLLTAEMVDLVRNGAGNILCLQPFGCLPNHITGKGVIKEIKRRYPFANITSVDYDPGASEVNQLNRIKLMMSVAKENLNYKIAQNQTKNNLLSFNNVFDN